MKLKDDTIEIRMSPDKPNIKLVTKKIQSSVDLGMAWMVDFLNLFPKTVIYCTSIRDVSRIYSYLTSEVPESVTYCDMFHSETPEATKNKILTDLCDTNGKLKIVIATSALGMGIDIPNTNCVILYGVPKQIVEVIQEIGRVGRDGSMALAVVLYNSVHLRHVEQDVKDILTTTKCRRMALLKPFISEQEQVPTEPSHKCCDICCSLCKCGDCDKDLFPLENMLKDTVSGSDSEATETDEDDLDVLMESHSIH